MEGTTRGIRREDRRMPRVADGGAVMALLLSLASLVAPSGATAQEQRNADIGYPRFKGDPQPVPATGVAFSPGGYLAKVFAGDLAHGAGSEPGKDFWIDRLLARTGTGGGFGDSNNWLFTRGRAAYMYTHKPEEPGFVGDAAYGFKTGHDALFRLQAELDGKPLSLKEVATARRQTPSYFTTVFEDATAGVRLRLVKFITQENVAVAEATLSSLDGRAHALTLKAASPMATHADGDELVGAFQAHNDITTVFPRLSGDGFAVEGGALARRVQVPARGEAPAVKLQLGLVDRKSVV